MKILSNNLEIWFFVPFNLQNILFIINIIFLILYKEELKKVMMENFEKVGVEVEEESLDRMVLVSFNCSHFLRPAVPILNSESYEGWPDRAFPEFTIF